VIFQPVDQFVEGTVQIPVHEPTLEAQPIVAH